MQSVSSLALIDKFLDNKFVSFVSLNIMHIIGLKLKFLYLIIKLSRIFQILNS